MEYYRKSIIQPLSQHLFHRARVNPENLFENSLDSRREEREREKEREN